MHCPLAPSIKRCARLLPGASDALPLQPKQRPYGSARRAMVITKASNEDGSDNSQRGSPPPRSKGPWEWLQQLVTFVRIQQPAKLVLNLLLGFFLVRLLPITGRPSSEGHALTVQVWWSAFTRAHTLSSCTTQVPFSEFVVRAKRNQVRAVSIDGNQLTYWLRSTNAVARELPPGADKMRLSFQTVRPLDFPTPYDTLVKNHVQFTAVDKRNNRFLNIMVRELLDVLDSAMRVSACVPQYNTHSSAAHNTRKQQVYCFYVGLLITALNRLPLKLPQRGAGRRHNNSGVPQQAIKFDDVAGVDEAKEELAEVVVRLVFACKCCHADVWSQDECCTCLPLHLHSVAHPYTCTHE